MAERTKRFWWLKLREDFFDQTTIKKLRRMSGGDTYTVIYLKMQLASLRNEGTLMFDNIEDTFAEELALRLDESTEDVQMTLLFLEKYGLIEIVSDGEYMIPEAVRNMDSESSSATRMRNMRERQREIASHCDAESSQCYTKNVTCDTEREKEESKRRDRAEKEREEDAAPTPTLKTEALVKEYGEEVVAVYIAKSARYGKNGDEAVKYAGKWLAEDKASGKVQFGKKAACVSGETSLNLDQFDKSLENFIPVYGEV